MKARRPYLYGGARMLRFALVDVIVQDIVGVAHPTPQQIEANKHRIENYVDSLGIFVQGVDPPLEEIPNENQPESPRPTKRVRSDSR